MPSQAYGAAPSGNALLDLAKPHIAEAVATIAPAVPAEMVDAIAEHLSAFSPGKQMDAAVRLAAALETAAQARAPAEQDEIVGVTAVALDMALRRCAEAAS